MASDIYKACFINQCGPTQRNLSNSSDFTAADSKMNKEVLGTM